MDYNENDLSYYQLQDEQMQEMDTELRELLDDESLMNQFIEMRCWLKIVGLNF